MNLVECAEKFWFVVGSSIEEFSTHLVEWFIIERLIAWVAQQSRGSLVSPRTENS